MPPSFTEAVILSSCPAVTTSSHKACMTHLFVQLPDTAATSSAWCAVRLTNSCNNVRILSIPSWQAQQKLVLAELVSRGSTVRMRIELEVWLCHILLIHILAGGVEAGAGGGQQDGDGGSTVRCSADEHANVRRATKLAL